MCKKGRTGFIKVLFYISDIHLEIQFAVFSQSEASTWRQITECDKEHHSVSHFLHQGDVVCTIESVKTTADAYAPVGGRVMEINVRLEANPELVNESPHDDGWLFALEDVRQAQFKGLLDAKAYEAYLAELDE